MRCCPNAAAVIYGLAVDSGRSGQVLVTNEIGGREREKSLGINLQAMVIC